MRPGTLVVIIALLVALLGFGVYLITYDSDRPEPHPSPPASVSP